ncbi:VanZ family protein [Stanieria cyanosphaera PCC 7437]|uniref:VanZ family protein n=1 Tax=Stanieria cyanosphaera (strain ATCC 29371 / PCC 7437) TaxID=111780 RepID=K9XT35_STAC7|nr:VanZ family protein [Stanieria cyanosphaera]AFZ34832.1 VanZ family protein [Stanieria cyanosphaera PCC 7437]
MKTKQKYLSNFSNPLVKFLIQWANVIAVVGSTCLILLATLFPFNFTPTNFSWQTIHSSFGAQSDLNDLVGNVLLFIPFGVSLLSLLIKHKIKLFWAICLTTLTSIGLSLSVEILQIFLPSRSSDYSDLITNSTGGLLGAIGYCLWNLAKFNSLLSRLLETLKPLLSRQKLAAALIIWVLFTGFVALTLQKATYFSNWATDFPLILGNEATGDRPWQGTISQLAIAPRAMDESEITEVFAKQGFLPSELLIANYALTGKDNYQDQTNQLPDLIWQGNQPQNQITTGVNVTSDSWLSTPTPATKLAQKLRQTSQFTISTIVTTANPQQVGPGRIITFSSDPFHRNFTLGQHYSYLIFRLRTPITGENGMYTGLSVRGIFKDNQPIHLILTYKHSFLRLYVNSPENLHILGLTPEITLFRYLFPLEGDNLHLTKFGLLLNKLLYYLLFFVPLGILTALIITLFPTRLSWTILLFMAGIVVPALLLELLIRAEYGLRIDNLSISIAIATITMLLVRNRLIVWLDSDNRYSKQGIRSNW